MTTDLDGEALPADRSDFVEQFGLFWASAGNPRMEGRILGYLMVTSAPYVSAARLAHDLLASAGSVSTCARRLASVGFIHRHSVPGDRAHYWAVDEDVWGSFLAGERDYLRRHAFLADQGLTMLGDDDADRAPRRRLELMSAYMGWLIGYHREMVDRWQQYRQDHDLV